jgi:hypothetical protein
MASDDQMRGLKNIINQSSHTLWRQMKRMRSDDQMGGLIQLSCSLTTWRCARERGQLFKGKPVGMIRWLLKQLTKFTYRLGTDEEDGMG